YAIEVHYGRPGIYGFNADVRLLDIGHSGWRLPTEIEWEVACRAGRIDAHGALADGALGDVAWMQENRPITLPEVGLKKANEWGLHDMLGLVWEWCWDAYAPYRLQGSPSLDPRVDVSEPGYRVGRGGSWLSAPR